MVSRLVHQQQLGAQGQHLGNRHPFPLAARELSRIAVAKALEPESCQPVVGLGVSVAGRDVSNSETQGHVLADRPPGQERVVLEEESDVARVHVEVDGAVQGLHQMGHHAENAGLTGAGGANQAGKAASLEVEVDAGEVEFEATRLRYSSKSSQRYRIVEGDPLSASIEYRADFAFARDDWQVRTESLLAVTCDATQFHLDGGITGYERTTVVSERTWEEHIPRIAY